jgi:hypothetical protein
MTQLEQIGELYLENRRLLGEYGKLLELVQRAKDGEVRLEQITVDLAGLKWAIVMTGEELTAAMKPQEQTT